MNIEKKIGCIISLYIILIISMLFEILKEVSDQVSTVYIVDNSTTDNKLGFF